MELNKKIYVKNFKKEEYDYFVLSGDIGGSNSNVGVSGVKGDIPTLLFSTHAESTDEDFLVNLVNKTLKTAKEEHDLEIDTLCLAVAGPVSFDRQKVFLTNAKYEVKADKILKDTYLKSVILMNDFEAVAYAVNLLDVENSEQIMKVKHVKVQGKQPIIAVGAGTGLGKSVMVYDDEKKIYVPIPCEAGHSDFPVHGESENDMRKFVQEKGEFDYPVRYEDFLSGRGLVNIYDYLTIKKGYSASDEIRSPKDISRLRDEDETCKEVFRIFVKFYARAIKNFVLGDLARGGVFIAGGIAANNKEIFTSEDFFEELYDNGKYVEILKQIPIYVMADYDLSLLGGALAAVKRQDLAIKKS